MGTSKQTTKEEKLAVQSMIARLNISDWVSSPWENLNEYAPSKNLSREVEFLIYSVVLPELAHSVKLSSPIYLCLFQAFQWMH